MKIHAFALIAVGLLSCACGPTKAACTVIDAAHAACAVIRYTGPDGKVRTVRVTREELAAFGQRTAAARGAK